MLVKKLKYGDLVGVSEPWAIEEDWLEVEVGGLTPGYFYVMPIFLWAHETRKMKVEIYHPEKTDAVFNARFEIGPNVDPNGNPAWVSKRYVLNSERHNGAALLRLGLDPVSDPVVGFQLYADSLTSKRIRRQKLIEAGRCPQCEKVGHWQAMAMVCPEHGVYLG